MATGPWPLLLIPMNIRLPLLALVLLPLLVPPVFGQQLPEPKRVFGTLGDRVGNDDDEAEVRFENEITTRISIPEQQFVPCQATVGLSYYQRNTLARVEVDIRHPSCPAASGEVEIVASVRPDGGENRQLVFPEQWALENGMVTLVRDYPIGENVELTRVRSRRVTCTCEL